MRGFRAHIRTVLGNSKWGLVKQEALDGNTNLSKELDAIGTLTEYLSDVAYAKVSDADFQTVMRSVGFHRPPREVLTIRDMERHHQRKINAGVEERGFTTN